MKRTISFFLLLVLVLTAISGATATAMEQPASFEALPFEFTVNMVDGEPLVEFHADTSTSSTSIELYIFKPDSKTLAYSAILTEGQTVAEIYNLRAETPYGFGVRYVDEGQITSTRGQLVVNVRKGDKGEEIAEIDTLVDFLDEGLPSDIALLATVYEKESNNTSGTANPVSNGDIVRGSITPVGDRDWFRVIFTGSGNASFSLSNIPSGCDYELCLYDSSVNLLASSLSPGSVDEYISHNVTAGRVYYIQVYAYQGTSSSLYTLRINGPSQEHTWYSQVVSEGGSFNWNRTKLDNLYFPNMQSCGSCEGQMKCRHTPFWTSSSYSPAPNQLSAGHMNKWGCMIAAHAMVLRNLGARTTLSRQDFRTGVTGNLLADPFIVSMVNVGWPSIGSQTGRYEITSYTSGSSPVYVGDNAAIAAAFGKQLYTYNIDSLSALQKAELLVTLIRENPAGVHVRFRRDDNYNSKHSLVFTGLTDAAPMRQFSAFPVELYETLVTPENEKQLLGDAWELSSFDDSVIQEAYPASVDTSYDGWFIAYDSATSVASQGSGVPFTSTYSWNRYYQGMQNLIGILVIK